ncbi:E3 ubiquitin-protein ligase BOI [Neltuma alba]|uniref:E3 ubiquitin-protein ligase BOI n=1 Tax=Neltuma alba TaxID=207710 RepID=UPI0010A32E20|nr:E3 ubiquitin-protein ligase BOI-like [Prosopis alba]
MAVESRHLNLFTSHFLNDRANLVTGGIHNNAQMDYSDLPLPAVSAMADQSLFPFYQSNLCDPNFAKTSMNNDDSGLTSNFSSSRKRSRDELISELSDPRSAKLPSVNSWSFLNQEVHLQIQNQQSEIDLLIAQHTGKVRRELEEQRRRQLMVLHSAIEEVVMKKLKEKDEEIQEIGKLNWALQERVKTLTQENQIWKELAETNEATANSLRCNLEQILAAHVSEDHQHDTAVAAAVADDAESSCGSSGEGQGPAEDTAVSGGGRSSERLCCKCGERESIVLLLPCRHLSLCTKCGSTSHHCPVCHSGINGSVHVNFS